MTLEEAMTYALTLDATERATHYGAPAIKANGRAILGTGHEAGSFVLHIDIETKRMLIETDPATYWQTPHYDGWPAVLVREDGDDPDRVRTMIRQARDAALARKPPRQRG